MPFVAFESATKIWMIPRLHTLRTLNSLILPMVGNSGLLGKSGAEGTRTPDPLHAMQVRYQLRHSPELKQ